MTRLLEWQKGVSLRLFTILEDIGVTDFTTQERRTTFQQQEAMKTLTYRLIYGENTQKCFYFGSQIEGSTTIGMESDIDAMLCDPAHVILDMNDWIGEKNNILIVKNNDSPPQHCSLQLCEIKRPEPLKGKRIVMPETAVNMSGNALLKNSHFDSLLKQMLEVAGCQFSVDKKIDYVYSYYCTKLPEECRIWLTRPRSGHWPTEKVLKQCETCGTFIVPVGHPTSDTSDAEWRFSTSFIERNLMFSLNTVHLKTYLILKMIKVTFFKPLVGDHFSSFHCKTALMYTIERTPADFWKPDRLYGCVMSALKTILIWLREKYCPHFTIAGVNLFSGKLSLFEINQLLDVVERIIQGKLQCLFGVEMDRFGERLKTLMHVEPKNVSLFSSKYDNECEIARYLYGFQFVSYSQFVIQIIEGFSKIGAFDVAHRIEAVMSELHQSSHGTLIPKSRENYLYLSMRTTLNFVKASVAVQNKIPPVRAIQDLQDIVRETQMPASKLKLAALYFVNGQYREVTSLLQNLEEDFHVGNIVQECGCDSRENIYVPSDGFKASLIKLKKGEHIRKFVSCLSFVRSEIPCTPGNLVFEMYRTITEQDLLERHYGNTWMDMAMVDPIPLVYYMQYLNYGRLGDRLLQERALENLNIYTRECFRHGHFETVLNLLGHCFEMENRIDLANEMYKFSLQFYPDNNAAKWHITRLLWACANNFYRTSTSTLYQRVKD
jgi:hypothetical protein